MALMRLVVLGKWIRLNYITGSRTIDLLAEETVRVLICINMQVVA
jgi:hypothetical protein